MASRTKVFGWDGDTAPFYDASGATPAHFSLRQVSTNDFELLEPFTYVDRDGVVYEVRAEWLGRTDIASVPSFLGWFARRHGDHTPAALLHDQLIVDPQRAVELPVQQRKDPAAADLLFRDALTRCHVPLVKAWLMWASASLRTRWHKGAGSAALIVCWFAAALIGTVAAVYGIRTGQPGLTVIALLAPIPFAALWGRQWQAGLVAGYAFWLAVTGSVPAWAAYQAYRLIEMIAAGLSYLNPHNRGSGGALPKPPPWAER